MTSTVENAPLKISSANFGNNGLFMSFLWLRVERGNQTTMTHPKQTPA